MNKEYYYRYTFYPSLMKGMELHCLAFEVIKHTKCGVIIQLHFKGKYKSDQKFINNNNLKRFAYPTKEEALKNFLICKEYEVTRLCTKIEAHEAHIRDIEYIVTKAENTEAALNTSVTYKTKEKCNG